MPEFISVPMQQCKQLSQMSVVVQGSKGEEYVVTKLNRYFLDCTCPGFKYRKTCKHLKQAEKQICTYHEQFCGPPDIEGICPKCGGETEKVYVAV